MSKKNPNSNKKSGGAGFIITLLLLSWITGFSVPGIIAGVLLGLGIGKITSIMGSGLDTTTHNRRDRQRQAAEEENARKQAEEQARQLAAQAEAKKRAEASRIPLTGDKTADQVILTGQDMLATIRKENAAIPDQELTEQMNNLSIKCEQIFRTVSESPSKAPQVRKFMNYYLPTTLKMLANYRTMQQRGVSYGEMKQARETKKEWLYMDAANDFLDQSGEADGFKVDMFLKSDDDQMLDTGNLELYEQCQLKMLLEHSKYKEQNLAFIKKLLG